MTNTLAHAAEYDEEIPLAQAYRAAAECVVCQKAVSWHVQNLGKSTKTGIGYWEYLATTCAKGWFAWLDLFHLLTPAMREEIGRTYPLGTPAISLCLGYSSLTVIEAISDQLGILILDPGFANSRARHKSGHEWTASEYTARALARRLDQGAPAEGIAWGANQDGSMVLDVRRAMRKRLEGMTWGSEVKLLAGEWLSQGHSRFWSHLRHLQSFKINFEDLRTKLIREARVVLAAGSACRKPIDSNPLDRRVTASASAELEASLAELKRLADVFKGQCIRGSEKPPKPNLPKLRPRDFEAWQASVVAGMTQTKIAAKFNQLHPGENWTQPRVSEAIGRADAHAKAMGLADKVTRARSRAPARTMDPAAAEQGKRMDGKAHHLRERERQRAKDGDDEE